MTQHIDGNIPQDMTAAQYNAFSADLYGETMEQYFAEQTRIAKEATRQRAAARLGEMAVV